MRRASWVIGVGLLLSATAANAQLSSGIIDPKRAGDWSTAGLPNGLPDAHWTQCGSTIAPYSGTADAINTQIPSCGANQYVLLGPGKFQLSSTIDFGHKASFALRGSGANQTSIAFSAATEGDCNLGATTGIAICSSDKTDLYSNPPVFMWTDGLAQGSTSLTLSDTTGITAGSMLFLTQDDDGYTGYPATGSSVDNGDYFVCADEYETGPVTGCAYNGPDGTYPSPFTHRWQFEIVTAKAVAGNVVTLSQPVRHPNFRAGQSPTAMLVQPLVGSGVENLSIDLAGNQAISYGVDIGACDGCWVSGVAVSNVYNWAIGALWTIHTQFQNNYVYNGVGPDSYGMRLLSTADSLVVNNIFHKVRASLVFDEPDLGSVLAYNFSINQIDNSDAMFLSFWPHSAGDDFELFEGNISNGIVMDSSHGGHLDETMFRNFNTGWESCANGNCGTTTTKDFGASGTSWPYDMRFGNVIGNVSGTPGFHSEYQSSDFGGCGGGKCAVYNIGDPNPGVTPPIPVDPLVGSTMLRWANWDSVTNDTRFCGDSSSTGFSTTCGSVSEVPTAAPAYPNALPTVGDTAKGQKPLPASFYYSSKPPFFGSVPWPPIGPDVQNGNVEQCKGTLNTPGQFAGLPATSNAQCTGTSMQPAWGGHVNAIPAMNCYLALGGNLDGTGGAIPFDANTCYGDTGTADGGGGGGIANGGPNANSNGNESGSSASGCGCRVGVNNTPTWLACIGGFFGLAVFLRRRKRMRRNRAR